MQRLLLLATLRLYRREPWQHALAFAGIALGVAAFVGIQSANRAAGRAFESTTSSFASGATHSIVRVGNGNLDDVYRRLVLSGYGNRVAPAATVDARIGNRDLQIVGVDPIKELRLRRLVPAGNPDRALRRLLSTPGGILVAPELAARAADTRIDATINGVERQFHIVGELAPAAGGGDDSIAYADIATIRALPDAAIDFRIDLVSPDEVAARALERSLPPDVALVPASDRRADLGAMTRAFATNLTALGLLALLVGIFLIHATMSFSVVRRRREIAILRGLGVTPGMVVGAFAIEALLVGTAAGIAGTFVGHWLADGLIRLVLRTMNDLAFGRSIAATSVPAWIYLLGVGVGIAATLVATALPAWEAGRIQPAAAERRSDVESRSRRTSWLLAAAAAPVVGIALATLWLWPQSLGLGFFALFLCLLAGAFLVPVATIGLMRALEWPVRITIGLPGVMAVRSVAASLSRTGVATAALAVAVGTVISIGLMIASFRGSLIDWIDRTLTADLYVLIDDGAQVPAQIQAWSETIDELPGVVAVVRNRRLTVPGPFGSVGLRAAERGPDGWGFEVVDGSADWETVLESGNGVVVSEPYAFRHRLTAGSELRLPTPNGPVTFDVAAISRDYNTAGPPLTLALDRYRALFDDDAVTGLGVHVAAGRDLRALARQIEATRPSGVRASVRSTAGIRDISLSLFDRTFEITSVLRGVAGTVAFFGVLSAVLGLQLERRREFAVLRSIGMSIGELRRHIIAETGLLGVAAGLTAMPIGAALAALLVFVINRRAFGWSMDFAISAEPVMQGFIVALAAAAIAGVAGAFGELRRGPIEATDV